MKPAFVLLFGLLAYLPAGAKTLITTSGTFPVPNSHWILAVSPNGYDLSTDQTWTDSPVPGKPGQTFSGHFSQEEKGDWKSPQGWFAFIDDHHVIWFFDGVDRLSFVNVPKDGDKLIPPTHAIPPPREVWQRLPADLQAKITHHG